MDRLYRMIGKAAQSAHPVLILGESAAARKWSPAPSIIPAVS